MKIKVSELTGPALDWAVAKCANVAVEVSKIHQYGKPTGETLLILPNSGCCMGNDTYSPSTDWSQGGPILDKGFIELNTTDLANNELWEGMLPGQGEGSTFAFGPTRLVAAMRCYAASILGDEVDIPEELI